MKPAQDKRNLARDKRKHIPTAWEIADARAEAALKGFSQAYKIRDRMLTTAPAPTVDGVKP